MRHIRIGQPARNSQTMVSCDNALRRCTSKLLARVSPRRVLNDDLSRNPKDFVLVIVPFASWQGSISALYRRPVSPSDKHLAFRYLTTSASPPLAAIMKQHFLQDSNPQTTDIPISVRSGYGQENLQLDLRCRNMWISSCCRASNARRCTRIIPASLLRYTVRGISRGREYPPRHGETQRWLSGRECVVIFAPCCMVKIRELDFLVVGDVVLMDIPCCTTVLELKTAAHASKRA
jgi:hypothetical protein